VLSAARRETNDWEWVTLFLRERAELRERAHWILQRGRRNKMQSMAEWAITLLVADGGVRRNDAGV